MLVSPVITQATTSSAWYARVAAYTAQSGAIMPQYIDSAPAQFHTARCRTGNHGRHSKHSRHGPAGTAQSKFIHWCADFEHSGMLRSPAPSKRSSRTQELAPLRPKRARSLATASCRSLSPKGTTHEGPVLLLSQLTPVLNVTRTGQCKLKF